MNLKLIEPCKEFFKDEVRILGTSLGLIKNICYKHPFPGPGLGIRIIGNISKEGFFQMNHPDLLMPLIAIDDQKIEAMVFNENSLVLMTDNENFGSTMSIFKELIRN